MNSEIGSEFFSKMLLDWFFVYNSCSKRVERSILADVATYTNLIAQTES